jgi:acetyltransferase-like isoleucine patch superfamily enzyme
VRTPEPGHRLPWDWYEGRVPAGVRSDPTAYIETAHCFLRYRSRQSPGATFGRGASMYKSSMLDIGPDGRFAVGDFAMLQGARIICDAEVTIGACSMLSWLVLVMDSYRLPRDAPTRRRLLERTAAVRPRLLECAARPAPVRIGGNVWIGFGACILPGVTIGDGAIIGARSVVIGNVEPFTVAAGNPARFIRRIADDTVPSTPAEQDRHG